MAKVMIAPATNRIIPSAANMSVLLLELGPMQPVERQYPSALTPETATTQIRRIPGPGRSPQRPKLVTRRGHSCTQMKARRDVAQRRALRATSGQLLTLCGQGCRLISL